MKDNCIFCKIVSGAMDADTIFENSDFKVIYDKFPASKGHIIILTKEHAENIYELDVNTASKLFALASLLARALKKVFKCDGLNILQNNGEVAGQTVNHFHLHLIPRYENDGIDLHWPTQEYLQEELIGCIDEIKREL